MRDLVYIPRLEMKQQAGSSREGAENDRRRFSLETEQ